MAYMFEDDNHNQYFVPEAGVVITWDERYENILTRDVRFHDEDVMALSDNSSWSDHCQCIDSWLRLEYRRTTYMDFAGHMGGGHIIDVTDDDHVKLMSIAVEKGDDWIFNNGVEGHDTKYDCMKIACRCLHKFVDNLPNY